MKKIKPKVGQVWRANKKNANGCGSLVITRIDTRGFKKETSWLISHISPDGRTVAFDDSYSIKKGMKLVAEYPTWQEAVNSKEFKL